LARSFFSRLLRFGLGSFGLGSRGFRFLPRSSLRFRVR